MFPGCLQDFSRMFSGCSDGSYWPSGIWWSFQMKVWTLKIQRNPMIPNYSMIPAAAIRWSPGIWWSPAIRRSPAIRWLIRSMDFDKPKVYGDTSITDGLVDMEAHPTISRNDITPKKNSLNPSVLWFLSLNWKVKVSIRVDYLELIFCEAGTVSRRFDKYHVQENPIFKTNT